MVTLFPSSIVPINQDGFLEKYPNIFDETPPCSLSIAILSLLADTKAISTP